MSGLRWPIVRIKAVVETPALAEVSPK